MPTDVSERRTASIFNYNFSPEEGGDTILEYLNSQRHKSSDRTAEIGWKCVLLWVQHHSTGVLQATTDRSLLHWRDPAVPFLQRTDRHTQRAHKASITHARALTPLLTQLGSQRTSLRQSSDGSRVRRDANRPSRSCALSHTEAGFLLCNKSCICVLTPALRRLEARCVQKYKLHFARDQPKVQFTCAIIRCLR